MSCKNVMPFGLLALQRLLNYLTFPIV